MNSNTLLLIFVVECSDASMSDTIYLNYFLRTFHMKEYSSNRLVVRFLCMDGKYNYNKKKVVNDIKALVREATANNLEYKVIYCIDTDRLNIGNTRFISEVIQYCKDNNYNLVLFNPEIETLFNVRIEGSKIECARRFKAHSPSKNSIDINRFLFDINGVINNKCSSNLERVIREVLSSNDK